MLVMFRFENYGSFKDEAVLDLRAVKSYKEHMHNLITADGADPLLKVVSIYGANASGKTTLVDAYACFGLIVRDSFSKNNKDEDVPFLEKYYYPFLLDSVSSESDTEFEGVFRTEDSEYRYGFRYNKNCITYEWLYRDSLVTGRTSTIFTRSPENGIIFRASAKNCEKYIPDIDSDVLVLSFLSSLKLRTSIFTETMRNVLDFMPVSCANEKQTDTMLKRYFTHHFREEDKPELLAFLGAIDVGIRDISVERKDNRVSVYSYHMGADGELRKFNLGMESDGTIRAMALYTVVSLAAKTGGGILIDELYNRLHPLLQKYLIDLIYEGNTGAQLIYTTHDISMMDKKYVRRDQVWFVDKNDDGVSSLYSLSDFRIRNDVDLGSAYLSGRYGGIPILKDFSFREG